MGLEEVQAMSVREAKTRRMAPLDTPMGLSPEAKRDISAALNGLLADVFALYMKSKNFHWHMSGPTSAIITSSWTNRPDRSMA
jgi:hypothetical protein